jgi:uncharacterized protein (TIGR00730 family)
MFGPQGPKLVEQVCRVVATLRSLTPPFTAPLRDSPAGATHWGFPLAPTCSATDRRGHRAPRRDPAQDSAAAASWLSRTLLADSGEDCRDRRTDLCRPVVKRVCVFCGAQPGNNPAYRAAAARFGALLARRGLALVYGAGRTGLMGALVEAALERGAVATGVVPRSLDTSEQVHAALPKLHVVPDLGARKALMLASADAFVALPGGYGTFDELLETVSQAQLGLHRKPTGVLNVAGYFDGLVRQFDRAVREGFITAADRDLLVVTDDAERLLDELAARAAGRR